MNYKETKKERMKGREERRKERRKERRRKKNLKEIRKIMPNMGTERNCGRKRSHIGYKISE